ncbi:MAG: trypsin-like peptidase domain-containing protein [Limnochordia bacterium]|jgi:S1-C subfamily serine protease|nr:trypsin-like peptidase domain-containing protein [Limnochordia bacterium]
MQNRKRIVSVLLLVGVLLVFSGVIAHRLPAATLVAEEAPVEHASITPIVVDNPYIIADIAEVASPATVFLSVRWPAEEQTTSDRSTTDDPFSNFFFDYWFNDPFTNRQPVPQRSAGSGFIIDETGVILTNQHVVGNKGDGQTITVIVDVPGLQREYTAEILGSDQRLDLAVLQILNEEEDVFPTVPLGDSDHSRIGEWTIAIGNPYGESLHHTVTVGVLSAKGREISILSQETGKAQTYQNLMQTDAAINSGNSGGPLLNMKGEVIGINTAVHASAQGIGFAIPINVAKDVLEELITTGSVSLPSQPWIGIYHQNLTQETAGQLRLPDEKGVLVLDVIQDSPAAEAGLQPWDIIRRIDDKDVFSTDDVLEEIGKHATGDEIMLTVLRQGEMLLIPVTLGDKPSNLR